MLIMKKITFSTKFPPFSAEELRLFDDRRRKRLSGESAVYSWYDAKKNITNKQK
jgi:hypothetical protein